MKALNFLLGEDFIKARSQWLYPTEPMQDLLRSILIAVPIFLFFTVLQSVFAGIVDVLVYHADGDSLKSLAAGAKAATTASDPHMANLIKSMIIGMFPAAVITIFLTVAASHLGLPKNLGTLPLQWPKIRPLGWFLILVSFLLAVSLISSGLFSALGINPDDYGVGPGGLNDPNSKAGLVEKALASLATEPGLFILALPGAVLGAPLVEEILFRGVLFAGLVTRLGRFWTVVLTAAVWAAAHLGAAPAVFALMIFFMGLVLGTLMLRFGSLWVPIACHTVWNLVVTLGLYHAGSGQ